MTIIETPQHAQLPGQQIARIHVVTPRADIQPAMQAALHELTAALQAQACALAGPWFAHHYRRPTETFDFDVCLPTVEPVAASGRVERTQTQTCAVIRTAYTGPYEHLHTAWREFGDWIDNQHIPVRGDLFEVYVSGPRDNPDPAHWRTEFNYPLKNQSTASPRGEFAK